MMDMRNVKLKCSKQVLNEIKGQILHPSDQGKAKTFGRLFRRHQHAGAKVFGFGDNQKFSVQRQAWSCISKKQFKSNAWRTGS
ncbi:MAG: hypothetical protein LBJ59_00460 [Zoogloeaceae bacterium]|jgi:hypothetical protein|nr:hypothetical protein [Zoogloeaceae bacterium]